MVLLGVLGLLSDLHLSMMILWNDHAWASTRLYPWAGFAWAALILLSCILCGWAIYRNERRAKG